SPVTPTKPGPATGLVSSLSDRRRDVGGRRPTHEIEHSVTGSADRRSWSATSPSASVSAKWSDQTVGGVR
ncbi:MAG TPA: hypothetical protein VGK56_02540, partial [Anaerolineales bacterium]